MWSTHTLDYYLALKRNAILTHATTWVPLEDMMLNDMSQSQKGKYDMILLPREALDESLIAKCIDRQ